VHQLCCSHYTHHRTAGENDRTHITCWCPVAGGGTGQPAASRQQCGRARQLHVPDGEAWHGPATSAELAMRHVAKEWQLCSSSSSSCVECLLEEHLPVSRTASLFSQSPHASFFPFLVYPRKCPLQHLTTVAAAAIATSLCNSCVAGGASAGSSIRHLHRTPTVQTSDSGPQPQPGPVIQHHSRG
jgi:hypothetical protein